MLLGEGIGTLAMVDCGSLCSGDCWMLPQLGESIGSFTRVDVAAARPVVVVGWCPPCSGHLRVSDGCCRLYSGDHRLEGISFTSDGCYRCCQSSGDRRLVGSSLGASALVFFATVAAACTVVIVGWCAPRGKHQFHER